MTKIADCVKFHGFFIYIGYLEELPKDKKEEKLDEKTHNPECWEVSLTIELVCDHTTGYSNDREWTPEGRELWLTKAIRNDNVWDKLSERTRSKFHFPVELIVGDAFLEQEIEDL